MRDEEAKFGPHKARTCEWTDSVKDNRLVFCGEPVYKTTAYCECHYNKSRRSSSSNDFEQEISESTQAVVPILLKEEEL